MGAIVFILLSLGVTVTAQNNCGPVSPEVENGNTDYPNGTELGHNAVITCNKGFNLIGNRVLTCGKEGWLGRAPTCEVVSCLSPPTVANANYEPKKESYEYDQVVRYSCEGDYTLNGSKVLRCTEDESFRPAPPKCVRVECKDLQIINGIVSEGSRPPHMKDAFLKFECNKGFKMVGSSIVTCGIDSKWSVIPQCKAGETGSLGEAGGAGGAGSFGEAGGAGGAGNAGGNSLATGSGIGTFVSIAVLYVQLFWL